MMYLDAAAFCGHWPYYRLRNASLEQMLEQYRAANIDGGLMSSLDAVFYQDPWEADEQLVAALAMTPRDGYSIFLRKALESALFL